jgi:hypothetical protein
MEKLQSLIFEVSEYIPNGKYLEIMDEVLKIHKYIEEIKGVESDSDSWLITIADFNDQANEILNKYYDNECGYYLFNYDLISELKEFYSPQFIADKLNWLFEENDCFYCPVYDDLIFEGEFLIYDFRSFTNEATPKLLDDTVNDWVQSRFNNVLNNYKTAF